MAPEFTIHPLISIIFGNPDCCRAACSSLERRAIRLF
jgi:hypothetical protein